MNAYSLLLDIGGTDLKIARAENGVLDEDSVRRFGMPNITNPKQGEAKYLPGIVLVLVNDTIEDFIKDYGTPLQILISGQMGSWILTDGEGKAFTDIISWQDTSYFETKDETFLKVYGDQYCREVNNVKNNGGEDWPGAPWRGFACVCLELHSVKPLLFHTLTSWIAWEMTGRINHVIHVTDAAASGILNIKNNKWLKVSSDFQKAVLMPRVLTKLEPIGRTPRTSIPVLVAVGDQQASLLGAGLKPNTVILNAGTGGQVAKLVINLEQAANKVRPYFEGQYLETITHIPSGRFIAKFLAKAKEFHGANLDWNWMWQEFGFQHKTSTVHNLDWNYESFLDRYINDNISIYEAKNEFLSDVFMNFTAALAKLNINNAEKIILAGGVAQKWKIMQQEIQKEFGISVEVAISNETTLNGLAKLDLYTANLARDKYS